MWASKPYRTACDLQDLITVAAKDCEPKDLASLGKTFATLEMLKLRLRMRPAPKAVDVTKFKQPSSPARYAASAGPSEEQ
jgi:hypothetical protein